MSPVRTTGPLAFVLLAGWFGPTLAAPQDCAEIAAAFEKLGQVPAFQQTILQDGMSMEATAIGDTLYMAMEGEVHTLPLVDGGRAEMFASIFDILTVKDCAALPGEELDGRAMQVFEYLLPPNPPFVPEATMQRLWVGVEDGLPYRATNPTGEVTLRYEGVEAPTP
jgi:hypothetical protein